MADFTKKVQAAVQEIAKERVRMSCSPRTRESFTSLRRSIFRTRCGAMEAILPATGEFTFGLERSEDQMARELNAHLAPCNRWRRHALAEREIVNRLGH